MGYDVRLARVIEHNIDRGSKQSSVWCETMIHAMDRLSRAELAAVLSEVMKYGMNDPRQEVSKTTWLKVMYDTMMCGVVVVVNISVH